MLLFCSNHVLTRLCCALFCCRHNISGPEVSRDIYLPIFFRLASLALGQAFACPCASEVSLNNRVQSPKFRPQQKHDITRIGSMDYQWIKHYSWIPIMCLIYSVWYMKKEIYLWGYELVSLLPTKPVSSCECLKSFYEGTSHVNK